MSLKNFKCDRCHKRSDSLFRLQDQIKEQAENAPWFCPNCMRLMNQPLDNETLRLLWALKEFMP
jgi:hypothetical protein